MRAWDKKVSKAIRMDREVEPPVKEFKPVSENLQLLQGYRGDLGKEYWSKWTNHYRVERGPIISGDNCAYGHWGRWN